MGRFGLGRWVDSAPDRFGPGSFRPVYTKKIDRQRMIKKNRRRGSGQGGCEWIIKVFVIKKIRGVGLGGGGFRVNVNEDLKFL